MTSDDSDDEPLSNLAAAKKLNPEKFQDIPLSDDFDDDDDDDDDSTYEPVKKKKKKRLPLKKLSVTIKLNRNSKNSTPSIVQRPKDVWLYLKDLNPSGPYCCLLCNEWFINRSKLIVHYILNHKRDFCGICRYFVPDRDAWQAHTKFHIPWPCSQCIENFQTESSLRQHLSSAHKLVHCRLCHFRLSDDDQYNTHLFQKHNVTNVSSKDEECPWELEYEGSTKFLCVLCSKSNNLTTAFFSHYMGFHHFTLKCFSSIISGRDPPFAVNGANVSADFVDGLKDSSKFGYVDLDRKAMQAGHESDHSANSESNDLLKALIPEIKQETVTDSEEKTEEKPVKRKRYSKTNSNIFYKGDEDFDVTLVELIVLEKCYFDYINNMLNDLNANIIPENSEINYDSVKSDMAANIECPLCPSKYETLQAFTSHMCKMHCLKIMPVYSCRVCATPFDSQTELSNHITKELSDFDDLWICQFCDKEFDNRQSARRHLTEHADDIEFDNCFSPHLGFKCKFCPTLFWNETDREVHQIRVHLNKHKGQFYKCDECSDTYSDKIWFIHHYLERHYTLDTKAPNYMLKCCICSLVAKNVAEMRSHFNSEHPEARKVFCSLDSCQFKPLSHRKSFQFHLRSVHNPETRREYPMNCNVCGREFSTARACGTHMAQVHGPGKFKCKLCSSSMHTSDERKLHYLICHPGRHPFECSECGKSFQYKSSLYMHKQEHSPNKQSFTCTYCSKVFAKKDSYREHVQIHEGPRHACSYCPMRFVQRSNMLRHERRHTGERPYACPQCPRTFADKGACTSHLRTHSKTTSYACIYCGQTFVQKSKLTYHTRRHTGENLETCTVCSKLFTSACSLREHMKTHINKSKEAIKCLLCDKKFQDERYMLRHLRTSHTRSIFTCPLCRKTLTSAAGLRGHVLTHSTVNPFACKCCTKSFAVKKTLIRHLRKRHNLFGNEINISDFYRKLDPRDCQLGLDEETMTTIFGPPKKVMTDILIGDFVTFAKNMALDKNQQEANDEEESSDGDEEDGDQNEEKDSDKESNSEEKAPKEQGQKGNYEGSECSEELEPTDFVSVKIEPLDDDADDNVV